MFFSVYYCIEESFENAISCILWLADAPVSEAAIAKGVKEGDVCFPKDFHMKITNQLVESNITVFCVTSGVLEPILTCFVTMLHRNHMACKMKDNHAAMIQDSDSLLCLEQLVKQGAGSTDVLMKKTLQLLEGNRLKLSFREDMHHECDAYMVLQYQFLLALHSKSASDMLKYAKALCDLMPDTHNSLIATVGDFEVLWHLHIQQYKDAGGSKVCVQDEEEADVLGNLMENITASMFDIGEEGTESNGTEGSSSGVHDEEDDDDVLTRSNATVTGVTSASTSSDSSSNSHNNSSNSGCAASGGESGRAGNMGVRCCIVRRLVEASKSWIFPERTNHIPLRFICSQCPGVFNNVFCWTSWQRGTVSRMHRTLWRLLFASRQTEIFQVVFIHHGTVSSYERVSK